jgi:hypothetical protein
MNSFITWFSENRKTIGYTIGTLNVLSGIAGLLNDEYEYGLIWLIIGATIIFDTREFK